MKRFLFVDACNACEFGIEIDIGLSFTNKRCEKYQKDLSFDEWGGFEKPEFCEIHGHKRIIKTCLECNHCYGYPKGYQDSNEKYCNIKRKEIEDYCTIPEWCKLEKII